MAKILDGRLAEYAYVKSVTVFPNSDITDYSAMEIVPTFQTFIAIAYELKDIDGNQISDIVINHKLEPTTVRQTVEEWNALVDSAKETLILGDKAALTGYNPITN